MYHHYREGRGEKKNIGKEGEEKKDLTDEEENRKWNRSIERKQEGKKTGLFSEGLHREGKGALFKLGKKPAIVDVVTKASVSTCRQRKWDREACPE